MSLFTASISKCPKTVWSCLCGSQGSVNSVLDLAFVSRHLTLTPELSVEEGISDHQMLFFLLSFGNQNQNASRTKNFSKVPIKQYNRANDESFIDHSKIVFEAFSSDSGATIIHLWLKFKNSTQFCEANLIPTKWKRTERKTPWISKKKNYSEELSQLARRLKEEITNAREDFFSSTLTSFMINQPHKFWRYLSEPVVPITTLEVAGAVTNDAESISNCFNKYFQSIFTRASTVAAPATTPPLLMPGIEITEPGILNLLLQIDVKKSAGPDNIFNVFLKRYEEQLVPFMYVIFTASLRTATHPARRLALRENHSDPQRRQQTAGRNVQANFTNQLLQIDGTHSQ